MSILQTPKGIKIRPMSIKDYEAVADLWAHIEGFYIRSVDDSREGVARFLSRNPNLSVVAEIAESNADFNPKSQNAQKFTSLQNMPNATGKSNPPKSKSQNLQKQGNSKQNAEMIENRSLASDDSAQLHQCPKKIVGSILCGHDGRYGSIYHACVHKDFRLRGIGKAMVAYALEGFRRENISSIALIAFSENLIGNAFWKTQGWDLRANANRYELSLNTQNTLTKIPN